MEKKPSQKFHILYQTRSTIYLIEIKKIVDRYQTGILINSLSPKDILNGLDKAIELKNSPSFSMNILKMNTTLNWEKEAEILKKTYQILK